MARSIVTQEASFKDIANVNRRIRDYAKKFGTDSATYADYIAPLIHSGYTRKNKQGIFQLENTAASREAIGRRAKKRLNESPTAAQKLREYTEQLRSKDSKRKSRRAYEEEAKEYAETYTQAKGNLSSVLSKLYDKYGDWQGFLKEHPDDESAVLSKSVNSEDDIITAWQRLSDLEEDGEFDI